MVHYLYPVHDIYIDTSADMLGTIYSRGILLYRPEFILKYVNLITFIVYHIINELNQWPCKVLKMGVKTVLILTIREFIMYLKNIYICKLNRRDFSMEKPNPSSKGSLHRFV